MSLLVLFLCARENEQPPFGSFPKRTTLKGKHTPVNACHASSRHEKSPHRSVQQNQCGDFYTSDISLKPSAIFPLTLSIFSPRGD
jgi:hypothetical protein